MSVRRLIGAGKRKATSASVNASAARSRGTTLLSNTRTNKISAPIDAESLALYASIGALILFVLVLLSWVVPRERAALAFTEAEVAFLFPAPISRRTLIHYKLLRSQIAIGFTTLFLTLLSNRAAAGGPGWMRVVGWWLILSTLNLHFLGAS